jgi:hypothetical protein
MCMLHNERQSNMCYVYGTWGKTSVIIVMFLLHEEREK